MKQAYPSLHPVRSREFVTVKAYFLLTMQPPSQRESKNQWQVGALFSERPMEATAWRRLSKMPVWNQEAHLVGWKELLDQRWMQPKSSLPTPEYGRRCQPNALDVTSALLFCHHFLLVAGAPQSKPS